MKVAIVGPYPFPGGQITGGVHRVIDILLQSLSQHVELTLIVPNSLADLRSEVHGVPVIYLARTRGPGVLTYWTSDARKLSPVIAEINPDIVHFQGVSGIARGNRRSAVLTVHGVAHRDFNFAHGGGSVLKKLMVRSAAVLIKHVEQYYRKQVGNVIVINPYVVSALPDITALRQFPINNPLDQLFTEKIPSSVIRPPRVVSIGRIGQRKHTGRGVAIAARLLAMQPDATAAFFGAPENSGALESCRKIAADFGVSDRLTFPGNVSAEQLRQELDRSSVLLMTSQQETAPMAIAEAHARGVAVLAPNSFGISYMITPGENGVFLLEAPVEEQATQLKDALAYPWNRTDIAARAKRDYGAETITRQTLDVYRSILENETML